jgi:hypothetical protein
MWEVMVGPLGNSWIVLKIFNEVYRIYKSCAQKELNVIFKGFCYLPPVLLCFFLFCSKDKTPGLQEGEEHLAQ